MAHSHNLVKYYTTINIYWLPTGKESGTIDLWHTTPTAPYPQPQNAGSVVTYTSSHTTEHNKSIIIPSELYKVYTLKIEL